MVFFYRNIGVVGDFLEDHAEIGWRYSFGIDVSIFGGYTDILDEDIGVEYWTYIYRYMFDCVIYSRIKDVEVLVV
ncbi:unannotated protein [freshwater metagenome]|uniref:Unannotated protein n=1 Tax=freshwater metagenome TaxID=449393 RepID=A0A6J6E6K9_9ZZZZ